LVAAEQQRQAALARQQEALRAAAAQRAAAEQAKAAATIGKPRAAPPAGFGAQGRNEPGFVYGPRMLLGSILSPVEQMFEGKGPIVDAAKSVIAPAQKATAPVWKAAFSTPASREAEAKEAARVQSKQVPANSQAARPSQTSQQPEVAPWRPFAAFQTGSPGQMPGAPRDGGSRLHAANAQDFSGMKVGTPIPAPPMGARLIGSGSGGNAGNWGKWQLPDGSSMRVMHLTEKPTQETVGPGQPLAFIGNSGNASTRNTPYGVAHVETWDAKGKPVAPTAFFGHGGAGGAQAGGQPGPAVSAFMGAVNSVGGFPQAPQMDYSGVDAHQQLLGKAMENIAADQTFTYKPPEYPTRPEPKPFQDINYEKSDAAFAAAAPKNPFGDTPEEQDKQQLKMRRASYWSGLGQAFANFRDGQGLGSLLANAGGAMLAGSMQGSERVREKLEEFDKLQSQFKMHEANRETSKATNTANLINQNLTQQNQYAKELWADNRAELAKFEPVFENGRARIAHKNDDGTTTVVSKLIDPSQFNPILDQMGLTAERKSGIRNSAAQNEYEQRYKEFQMMVPLAFQDAMSKGDVDGAMNLANLGASGVVNELVKGQTWRQEVEKLPDGARRAAELNFKAWQAAGLTVDEETGEPVMGQSITQQQKDDHDSYLRSNLVQQFLETKQMYRLLGGGVEQVYTDQPGMPKTGKRFDLQPDTDVVATILGNRAEERQVTRRSSRKLPFGGSESMTVKGGY